VHKADTIVQVASRTNLRTSFPLPSLFVANSFLTPLIFDRPVPALKFTEGPKISIGLFALPQWRGASPQENADLEATSSQRRRLRSIRLEPQPSNQHGIPWSITRFRNFGTVDGRCVYSLAVGRTASDFLIGREHPPRLAHTWCRVDVEMGLNIE